MNEPETSFFNKFCGTEMMMATMTILGTLGDFRSLRYSDSDAERGTI